MFSGKDLRKLIIPLIIEQILAVAMGLADTVMVSSCGEAAVSGISLVDSINFLFITLFNALATGGTVITSQYLGSGDKKNACRSSNQLLYAASGISLLLMLISVCFRDPILYLIYGNIETAVMDNSKIYFLVSAISFPFLAVFNSGAALFRAMGDSRTSMITSMCTNILNVGGNALLIYVFQMGVLGAALATLVSRIVGAVIITVLLLNKRRVIHYDGLLKFKVDLSLIKKILGIGVPNAIENSIFQIGKILVASMLATFGTASITANAVAGNLASIQIIPGSAIGTAMVTVIGQCAGAKKYDDAKKYIKKLMLFAYIATWFMTLLLTIFIDPVLTLYNLDVDTVELTKMAFMIHGICATVCWATSFALPNALRGAGDVKYTMYVSLFSMWIFRIGFCYILAIYFNLGLVGVWSAMCIDWFVRSIFFVIRTVNGKWTTKSRV